MSSARPDSLCRSDRWGCCGAAWSVPTCSGIAQAGKRLGAKAMADVFADVVEPEGGR